jgi:hypothetical protein
MMPRIDLLHLDNEQLMYLVILVAGFFFLLILVEAVLKPPVK